jgi:hypothetical protein
MANQTAEQANQAEVCAQLDEKLRQLEAMMRENVATDEIARFLYWPEIVVANEGVEKVYRTFPEFLEMFADVVDSELSRDASWTSIDPVLASGDLAVALYQVTFRFPDGREDLHSRALYTWQRRGDEWKVAMEMAGAGTLN